MYVNVDKPEDKLWYFAPKSTFTVPTFRQGVFVNELTSSDTDIIEECITLFNSEINWVGMFNLQTALERFKDGHRMFTLHDDSLLGYCWVDVDYLYNFFVCRNRVKGDSQDFCNFVCNTIGRDIRLYVVRPNIKGQKFFEGVGFKRISSYI